MVEWLFLTVPRGCLQFVIVVFPDHTHLLFLSDLNISNVEDDSSESENSEFESDGYNSDASEYERNSDLRNTESAKQVTEVQVSDKMIVLQGLSKEFEKTEAVGEKVDEILSKVVDTGIRAQSSYFVRLKHIQCGRCFL